uniref:Trimethylguanosine synthase n=1 Tax=Panagrellus redivivus TaxID=6233 RepID=A0A7E4WDB6_PANRE
MEPEIDYRYEWDPLLEADLTLPVEADRSVIIKALFSKSYIDDIKLWASGDNSTATKMAELNINTEESPKSSPKPSPAFSPLKSTSSTASDEAMSDEEPTDPETAAMIAMGLPTNFTPTPSVDLRKKTARKPGKDVNFNSYWTRFKDLFVNLVAIAEKTNNAAAVDEVLQPAVIRGAGLLVKHKTADRFLELAAGFSDQKTYNDLTEYVKHYIDLDVRESNVIGARNAAQGFVARLHKCRFTHGFRHHVVEGELKRRPETATEVLAPFTNVKFTKHEAQYGVHNGAPLRSYCMDDLDAPEEVKVEAEPAPVPMEVDDPMNFDFSFDPERDARLVAKDALKYNKEEGDFRKYWFQRNRLFTKLNDGILMDEEGWYSVTPERIAVHLAQRIVYRPNMIILDAFTGVGGNAIQFALQGAIVYAVDLDPVKIRCARRNAEVYGVLDRITFICGNCFHVVDSLVGSGASNPVDAIFLSPPWGGPAYLKMETFPLSACTPDGIETFKAMTKLSDNIAYFLPRNTSSNELAQLSGLTKKKKVEVEHNVLNNKVKALTAYYGNLVGSLDL